MPHPSQLLIYCDGGFGNRLNALFSGLGLARALGLHARVFWPRNNWCQAGFNDIFETTVDLDERTLSQLAGTLDDCIPLLHDTLGSDAVRVPFNSAYGYTSVDDFAQRVITTGRDVFYYPAVMPPWVPMYWVIGAMRACVYQATIRHSVEQFIQERIGQPFYGLHLRRTDLGVGYSDDEVREIVVAHPGQKFFVCSDDPIAESLACAYGNVLSRNKQAYVGRRNDAGGWTALTADDDGRLYHSNIDRSADSVVDAVIDLLILAHSEIVGYSGSTFQNIARLYGAHAALVAIQKPTVPIDYVAQNTVERQIHGGVLTPLACANVCVSLYNQGRKHAAIALETLALEVYKVRGHSDPGFFVLHYNLAAHLLNEGQPYRATLYLQAALQWMPGHTQTQDLLKLAQARCADAAAAKAQSTGTDGT
jgi:hypothetical protein